MQNPLGNLSILHGRSVRTHGGFGFAPPPRVSRQQATIGAACIASAILMIAASGVISSMTDGDIPQQQAAVGQRETIVSEQPEAVLASAPAEAGPAAPARSGAAEIARPAPTAAAMMATQVQAPTAVENVQVTANAFAPVQETPAPPSAGMQPELLPDTASTAAIGTPAPEFESVVAVADSTSEVAQLEAEQQVQNDEILAEIREENGTAFNSPVMGEARVNRHVNMRAGPSDEARVLMIVPSNARIQAAKDCNWCEVAYEGKRGFIYKSFIRW